MAHQQPLQADQLHRSCRTESFDFITTDDLEPVDLTLGQQRAMTAIGFGLGIQGPGYNIFALGPSGTGKRTAIRQLVERIAADQPVPSDWCYLNNFDNPSKPVMLQLEAGEGLRFRDALADWVDHLNDTIHAAFDDSNYAKELNEIAESLNMRRVEAIDTVREAAEQKQIKLLDTLNGFALVPMDEDGKVMESEAAKSLDEPQKKAIEAKILQLQKRLRQVFRSFPQWTSESEAKVGELTRTVIGQAIAQSLEGLRQSYHASPPILDYLTRVEEDLKQQLATFEPNGDRSINDLQSALRSASFEHYKVNLLIDRSDQQGAPVIVEEHPTYANLIGRVEYDAQMGTLVTDFSRIQPGALHRANGGYLIIDANRMLRQPYGWESLKQVLYNGELHIESLEKRLSLTSYSSLEPEPIPFAGKVILFGDRELYYLLCGYDSEFSDLFKVAADFDASIERDPAGERHFARQIATLIQQASLRSFDCSAVGRVIEQCARRVEDRQKLSIHQRSTTDLLREADYCAGEAGRSLVTAADVQRAIDHQIDRASRIQQRIQEQMQRGVMMIDTAGAVVGQVNGLSVYELAGYEFGHPVRITATTRAGEGGVIDIEREIELGGALHSKGVLILSSFLAARYAREQILSITASLVFEQSYGYVDGDSASLGELCALLSSLADLPIRQAIAVTGSVNQLGRVQPIGGVNEKIEGFFDLCRTAGLSGEQGVVIPAVNVQHLMLRRDVVEAASAGQFHIYAVSTVDQALALLTGIETGVRDSDGAFPEESLNGRVEKQCLAFAAIKSGSEHSDHKGEAMKNRES